MRDEGAERLLCYIFPSKSEAALLKVSGWIFALAGDPPRRVVGPVLTELACEVDRIYTAMVARRARRNARRK